MKIILKLIFLFLSLFLPFCGSAFCCTNSTSNIAYHEIHSKSYDKVFTVDFYGCENAVLKINAGTSEIFSAYPRHDFSFFEYGLSKENVLNSNKVLLFAQNHYGKFHNISSNLENEICTRAP